MKQAFDYCTDVINETRTSFSKGVRNEKKLFDSDAFREVWFNACLHNNWADGTPPAIYVYTDRMEIVSTGGLPANLSKEDFFKGISKPVNEELAKLSGKSVITIKRHITKLSHIKYVGSGYSRHWEIIK